MGSPACDFPIIQYQNLIGVQNRTDSLRYNDHGRIFYFLFQSFAEFRIRFHIQRGKTVVENKNPGLFGNRPCNCKTLLLPAGHIASALGDRAFISFVFFFNKIGSLGDFGCFPNQRIIGIRISKPQIRSDRTGE